VVFTLSRHPGGTAHAGCGGSSGGGGGGSRRRGRLPVRPQGLHDLLQLIPPRVAHADGGDEAVADPLFQHAAVDAQRRHELGGGEQGRRRSRGRCGCRGRQGGVGCGGRAGRNRQGGVRVQCHGQVEQFVVSTRTARRRPATHS